MGVLGDRSRVVAMKMLLHASTKSGEFDGVAVVAYQVRNFVQIRRERRRACALQFRRVDLDFAGVEMGASDEVNLF